MSYSRVLTKLFVAGGLLTVLAFAQAAIPAVPPEILAQLQNMSPAEQKALARQYGFDLDQVLGGGIGAGGGDGQRPALGAPGEPLEQVQLDGSKEEGVREPSEEEAEEETERELQRFGSNLFDSEVSTFAPVDNIPVPEGYRLGVGDELRVMLIGKEQGDYPLLIDRDGSVTLPKLGRVVLSGLTFSEAKRLIEKRVEQQLIGSEAILSMGSLRSINVFMAGELKAPGNYSISALSTLSQSIFIAGGIADTGSYRAVQLKRQGKTVQSFDLYDLLLYGDNSGDVRLQSGDVVFVPVVGAQASIAGEVVRPAIYEFQDGDTIDSLVKMAGGVLATGNPRQALLRRYRSGSSLPSIDNLNLLEGESLDRQVTDGDALSVASMSKRLSNPIAIDGETELDELIGWTDGLTVADVFTNLEADVEPTADLNLSLIVRRKNSLNDIVVLPFSLSEAVLNPTSDDNMELQPFDRIVVLPQPAAAKDEIIGLDIDDDADDLVVEENSRLGLLEPIVERLERQTRSGERAQVVNVAGAVREPGLYPLIGDGSIADVVSLAGGYTDAAYLERVEVRRMLLNQTQEAEVEILNISLANEADSSFKLIGRDTLRINGIPNWSTEDTVELSGEFLFPGTYTIFEGESIANLIERAGGLTEQAFLNGAQYFSATARASQAQQLKKISASVSRQLASRKSAGELAGGSATDAIENVIDEELLGRVVIDLQGIIDGDETANTFVDNGDTLYVPKYSNTIAVVGEVYEPGTFRFEEGLTLEQYLQIAGGTTRYAIKNSTYLLKADGSVRFYRSNRLKNLLSFDAGAANSIEAGDAIVIPTNLDYDPPLTRISAITGVVFQSLSSVAAFFTLAKQ